MGGGVFGGGNEMWEEDRGSFPCRYPFYKENKMRNPNKGGGRSLLVGV
jgi:hypothetical protein